MSEKSMCTQTDRITTLEVQMEEVIGNGQPGRLGKAEEKLESHSKLLWMGMGGLYVLQIIIGLKLFFKI